MTAKIKETAMRLVFALAAVLSVLAVIFICIFLFAGGAPAFRQIGVLPFLTGQNWRPLQNEFGIFPMIIGSIYVTAGAIVVGVPFGIGTAVFLARFCPAPLYRVLKPAVNLLAGIPSIVYGFFGLTVLVPAVQALFGTSGKGVLTASLVLGIMILPTIINVSESALRAVPNSYYEGALALGATKERAVLGTLLPAAKSGVSGRAIVEDMAVSMVAGNQPIIPKSLTDGVRTLTANIVLEMAYAADLHRQALIATGVVLFVFILIINLLFSILKQGGRLWKRNYSAAKTPAPHWCGPPCGPVCCSLPGYSCCWWRMCWYGACPICGCLCSAPLIPRRTCPCCRPF